MPLVLHPLTAQALTSFEKRPSHAVLIHGPTGIGKTAVANHLAAAILGITPDQLATYPYLSLIDAQTVSSDSKAAVNQLQHFLSLRVPKSGTINRVVIITGAQELSLNAQNALLKTLEEPPLATLMILTADSQAGVLPTIVSRVQAISIKRPPAAALTAHFKSNGHADNLIDQAYAMSGGLPGLMEALLTNTDHPLQSATVLARQLLQQTTYQRLLIVDSLTKDKPLIVNTLFIVQQMAHSRLLSTTGNQFNRWQRILEASYVASEQLSRNGQPKLVLDALMLKLH